MTAPTMTDARLARLRRRVDESASFYPHEVADLLTEHDRLVQQVETLTDDAEALQNTVNVLTLERDAARAAIATVTEERDKARSIAAVTERFRREDAASHLDDQAFHIRRWQAAEADLTSARADGARLREAIRAFLAKWELVLPAINSAFLMQHIHRGHYTGPTIDAELEALKALAAGAEEA